jgi:hypothetical protein
MAGDDSQVRDTEETDRPVNELLMTDAKKLMFVKPSLADLRKHSCAQCCGGVCYMCIGIYWVISLVGILLLYALKKVGKDLIPVCKTVLDALGRPEKVEECENTLKRAFKHPGSFSAGIFVVLPICFTLIGALIFWKVRASREHHGGIRFEVPADAKIKHSLECGVFIESMTKDF